MKKRIMTVWMALALAVSLLATAYVVAAPNLPDTAVPRLINYQGVLTDPATGDPLPDGNYPMTFSLYEVATGGTPLWSETQTVSVEDGLFTVLLGSAQPLELEDFTGTTYLGVKVGADPEMTPRQQVVSVAYALQAQEAANANTVDGQHASAFAPATHQHDARYWLLTGNAGTNPATHFLGTTDNQALELRVNNARALRLEPNATSPNLIGGYSGNSVTAGVIGATIGGGGSRDDVYGNPEPNPNRVTDNYGTVGGGMDNQAGNSDADTTNAYLATVGGGEGNTASSFFATVGGGGGNTASIKYATVGGGGANIASGDTATIGGGWYNTASNDATTVGGGEHNTASGWHAAVGGGWYSTASGYTSFVGGGHYNTASGESATIGGGGGNTASGHLATIGGGWYNTANGQDATISGGVENTASGFRATVGGGYYNTASGSSATVGGGYTNTASGSSATVPGGVFNTAQGDYSFAAGRRAKANHNGSFVFADSKDFDFASVTDDTFRVRATGGMRVVVAIDASGNPTWSCLLNSSTGNWSCSSDRNLKENLLAVHGREVLMRLSSLPIYTWNAKGADPASQHMGPTGQDFYAAFGLGDSDTAISTIDLDGVALAATQGLYEIVQEQDAQITAQQQRIDDLEARLTALEEKSASSVRIGLWPGVFLLSLGLVLSLPKGRMWWNRQRNGR